MKIKQTRQVRLDELISWAWNNDVKSKRFCSDKCNEVYFDRDKWITFDCACVTQDERFTITEEVEITEDIALDEMVIVQTKYFDGHKTKYVTRVVNRSIKECKRTKDTTLHEAWTINGNGIGELIWSKERGLVD